MGKTIGIIIGVIVLVAGAGAGAAGAALVCATATPVTNNPEIRTASSFLMSLSR